MRFRDIALAAAGLIVLYGCGNSTPTSNDEAPNGSAAETAPRAEPATGTRMVGSSYTYSLPVGWGEPPQGIPGFDPDTLAIYLDDEDGFADNVNTIQDPSATPSASLDEIESGAKRGLETFGAENVTIQDRLSVAGNPAIHLSSRLSMGGDHWVESYYVGDGSEWWAVTFSFSPTVGSGERTSLAESVLATWEWTG